MQIKIPARNINYNLQKKKIMKISENKSISDQGNEIWNQKYINKVISEVKKQRNQLVQNK